MCRYCCFFFVSFFSFSMRIVRFCTDIGFERVSHHSNKSKMKQNNTHKPAKGRTTTTTKKKKEEKKLLSGKLSRVKLQLCVIYIVHYSPIVDFCRWFYEREPFSYLFSLSGSRSFLVGFSLILSLFLLELQTSLVTLRMLKHVHCTQYTLTHGKIHSS